MSRYTQRVSVAPEESTRSRQQRIRLFWRVFGANAAVLVAAFVLLALSPATVSFPIGAREAVVLCIGLFALLVSNLVLLRRAFASFDRLVRFLRGVQPDQPGARAPVDGAGPDVRRITAAINDMLSRLEHERQDGARRRIRAQEDERRRVSRELHDEVGQLLTVALLQLDHAGMGDGADAGARLAAARTTLEQVHAELRTIAHRLRPSALDDLGLTNAIVALADSYGPPVRVELVGDAGHPLPEDVQIALFRVAQEACSNAVRHAAADDVLVRLTWAPDAVALSVSDNGVGIAAETGRGLGLPGMRERAALIGARLEVTARNGGGTVVSLTAHGGQHPLDNRAES